MGSPTIFSGSRTKLLTSKGFLLSDGETIDNDGQINYIRHNSATDIGIWTRYKNATATDTPDGTNTVTGTLGITFTRDTTAPLRGAASFLLTKPASNVQGEGFSYDFTIDNADKGKVLQGSFDYQITSGTFVDDAMTVWIYDITNSRLIQPAPTKLKNSGIIERFPFEFQTSIDSTSYRLIVHQSSTSTTACTIKFDNFKVGPTAKAYGSAVTDWVSFTAIPSWASSTITGKYRRIGDSAEIQYNLAITSPSGSLTIPFPSGLVVDTSKLSSNVIGSQGEIRDVSVGVYDQLSATYTFGVIVLTYTQTGSLSNAIVSATAPVTFVTGDSINFSVKVPILGWSSSQVMSSDADTRVVNFVGYVASNQVLTALATNLPLTAQKDSHGAWNGSGYVVKVPGDYQVSSVLLQNTTITNAFVFVNGINKGVLQALSTTQWISGYKVIYDLVAGDIVSIRVSNTSTVQGDIASSVSIARISGPAQIAASESVNALYTTSSASVPNLTSASVVFTNKRYDSHNSYNTTTGIFTAPVSGKYHISSLVHWNNLTTAGITLLLVTKSNGEVYYGQFSPRMGTEATPGLNVTVSLLAGESFALNAFHNDGVTRALSGDSSKNYISIDKVGNY